MKTNIKDRQIFGNWYAPKEWIKEHKSIVVCGLWNTTSSAGDWDGYFIQKFSGKYGLFIFSQENRAFNGLGFNLYINPNAVAIFDYCPLESEIFEIMKDWRLLI